MAEKTSLSNEQRRNRQLRRENEYLKAQLAAMTKQCSDAVNKKKAEEEKVALLKDQVISLIEVVEVKEEEIQRLSNRLISVTTNNARRFHYTRRNRNNF